MAHDPSHHPSPRSAPSADGFRTRGWLGRPSGIRPGSPSGFPFGIWQAVALIAVLAVGVAIGRRHWLRPHTRQDAAAYKFMQRVVFTRALIRQNFYRPISDKTLMAGAINGMLGKLDPYSVYFPHQQWSAFDEQVHGVFTGIGIVTGDIKHGGVVIVRPIYGSPAQKAGIKSGDKILAVNGQLIAGWKFARVLHALSGTQGTFLNLKLLAPLAHTPFEVTLRRTLLTSQSVQGFRRSANGQWDYLINPRLRIAYVHITAFEKATPKELDAALLPLIHSPAGLHGLILDLRFNPGGLVASGVAVARRFIKSGVIVTTHGRMGAADSVAVSHGRHLYPYFPVAVLINGQTASAAELLTGALQCYHRAKIFGTQSFGKGCMQNMFPLPGGRSAIKLTTALYYLPDGKNIARHRKSKTWGIEPSPGGLIPISPKMVTALYLHMKESGLVIPPGAAARNAVFKRLALKVPAHKFIDPQLAGALTYLAHHGLAMHPGTMLSGEMAASPPVAKRK